MKGSNCAPLAKHAHMLYARRQKTARYVSLLSREEERSRYGKQCHKAQARAIQASACICEVVWFANSYHHFICAHNSCGGALNRGCVYGNTCLCAALYAAGG